MYFYYFKEGGIIFNSGTTSNHKEDPNRVSAIELREVPADNQEELQRIFDSGRLIKENDNKIYKSSYIYDGVYNEPFLLLRFTEEGKTKYYHHKISLKDYIQLGDKYADDKFQVFQMEHTDYFACFKEEFEKKHLYNLNQGREGDEVYAEIPFYLYNLEKGDDEQKDYKGKHTFQHLIDATKYSISNAGTFNFDIRVFNCGIFSPIGEDVYDLSQIKQKVENNINSTLNTFGGEYDHYLDVCEGKYNRIENIYNFELPNEIIPRIHVPSSGKTYDISSSLVRSYSSVIPSNQNNTIYNYDNTNLFNDCELECTCEYVKIDNKKVKVEANEIDGQTTSPRYFDVNVKYNKTNIDTINFYQLGKEVSPQPQE